MDLDPTWTASLSSSPSPPPASFPCHRPSSVLSLLLPPLPRVGLRAPRPCSARSPRSAAAPPRSAATGEEKQGREARPPRPLCLASPRPPSLASGGCRGQGDAARRWREQGKPAVRRQRAAATSRGAREEEEGRAAARRQAAPHAGEGGGAAVLLASAAAAAACRRRRHSRRSTRTPRQGPPSTPLRGRSSPPRRAEPQGTLREGRLEGASTADRNPGSSPPPPATLPRRGRPSRPAPPLRPAACRPAAAEARRPERGSRIRQRADPPWPAELRRAQIRHGRPTSATRRSAMALLARRSSAPAR